ncbi:hypothetical protein [Paraburkholderia youngii]|uniref:hypothetical protein n=1 Tax=Paraburkholderia youngii TaxID=2782701 RepID=UPI003D1AE0AD
MGKSTSVQSVLVPVAVNRLLRRAMDWSCVSSGSSDWLPTYVAAGVANAGTFAPTQ